MNLFRNNWNFIGIKILPTNSFNYSTSFEELIIMNYFHYGL